MKSIYEKINLWLILSIIICIITYLISSLIHGSFDIREWSAAGRFITGFIMAAAICITGDEISKTEE